MLEFHKSAASHSSPPPAPDYDVIIVGCGPVGAVAAHLLGQHGVSTLILERDDEPHDLPRAIHIDHEVMRILQSAGLAQRLLPHLSVPAGAMHFGADRAVIRQFQQMVETDRLGWASDYFFYQPQVEAILRASLADRPSVRAEFGREVVSVHQDEDRVAVVTRDRDGAERAATARYLLGCDGGRSTVRRSLGGTLDDLGFDEPWIVVDAMVDGPLTMPELVGTPADVDMQEVMFIVGDPARPTSVIPGVGRHRRWEFMMLPGERAADFADADAAVPLIAPWLGAGQPCEIVRCAVYRFHALLARDWRVGRVLLLGDAAHQTPPFYGQGLCHGIRDAANLGWKLRLVLNGLAPESLLDTYQRERLPQVRSVVEASMRVGRYICTLDPAAAALRDDEMRAAAMRTRPGYVDLIPSLTDGVLDPNRGDRSPAGSRFIQPPVLDLGGARMLLDEATGGGFVLLCRSDAMPSGPVTMRCFQIIGMEEAATREGLTDCTGELAKWFEEWACEAVLLRPDAYVYGVSHSLAETEALVANLAKDLGFEAGRTGETSDGSSAPRSAMAATSPA